VTTSNLVFQWDPTQESAAPVATAASDWVMLHQRRGTSSLKYLLLPQHSRVRQRLKTAVVIKENCSGSKELRGGKRTNSYPESY